MLDKIKSLITSIFALIGLALGAFFLWKKSTDSKVDQVLADNDKVKAQIKEEDKQIASNDAQLAKEEQTRKDLQNDQETPENLVNFFNRKQ